MCYVLSAGNSIKLFLRRMLTLLISIPTFIVGAFTFCSLLSFYFTPTRHDLSGGAKDNTKDAMYSFALS